MQSEEAEIAEARHRARAYGQTASTYLTDLPTDSAKAITAWESAERTTSIQPGAQAPGEARRKEMKAAKRPKARQLDR